MCTLVIGTFHAVSHLISATLIFIHMVGSLKNIFRKNKCLLGKANCILCLGQHYGGEKEIAINGARDQTRGHWD